MRNSTGENIKNLLSDQELSFTRVMWPAPKEPVLSTIRDNREDDPSDGRGLGLNARA